MKRRIFLVDDEKISNFLNRKLLEAAGVNAIIEDFLESSKALKILKTRTSDEFPDLLIIDLRMPVLHGLDFLEELQKSDNIQLTQLKAIILTSSLDKLDKERADNLPNVIEFMNKPLNAKKVNTIKEYFSQMD